MHALEDSPMETKLRSVITPTTRRQKKASLDCIFQKGMEERAREEE